ncbi:unnamed protein product [Urochloa decumbens]|uniref:F-box protein AT5G49610-like beta-propeller domain-containing protein n=1 Tax=Urochloa decumbens TaxID=240449 RepID=A0ABC9FMI3_9POAL
MAPPPRPPPALVDELVEEILIRTPPPPDDPAGLVRATLACKRWRRIVSDPGFRRRFLELHRAPPMLGFLCNIGPQSSFVSTSSFRPPCAACSNFPAIDARHGRVLLHSAPWVPGKNPMCNPFVVWDPVTGDRRELPRLLYYIYPFSWNAAVLCASAACDHLDCRRGPFLVVFVVVTDRLGTVVYVYSSETDAWSEQASARLPGYNQINLGPTALVGSSLYFTIWHGKRLLKYDLATQEVSVLPLPTECFSTSVVPLTTEDGRLGFTHILNKNLCLWSREAAPDGIGVGWALSRVIELETLLPCHALSSTVDVAGFADGVDVMIVRTNEGIFTIDLKSCQVTKV